MPCRVDIPAEYYEEQHSIVLALLEELRTGVLPSYYGDIKYEKVFGKSDHRTVDGVTVALCFQIRELGGTKGLIGKSPEINKWWKEHKEADIQRETWSLESTKASIKKKKEEIEELEEEQKTIEGELKILESL